VLLEWPVPVNVGEVRSFISTCSYYRRYAAVYGLKQFKQYLLGWHFVLRSDHAALTFLRSSAEPVGQQARWLDFFEIFDFELIHRAGISNQNADGLSRRPYEVGHKNNCRQCHKSVDATLHIHAVTTRRQTRAATDGVDNVVDSTTRETLANEYDAAAVPDSPGRPRRRRVRRRGARRVPPHASTDMADIAPSGWSPAFLAAEQSADDDLRQLKEWKAGEVNKSTWFEMRGRSPTLKADWQQYDSIVIVNGVLYRQFH